MCKAKKAFRRTKSMRRLLKLVHDVPVEIALSCAEGVNVVSPRGTPAVKYTLVDGRTFFATRYVAEKFKKMNIQPNEQITLCMRKIDGKSITVVERAATNGQNPDGQAEGVRLPRNGATVPEPVNGSG